MRHNLCAVITRRHEGYRQDPIEAVTNSEGGFELTYQGKRFVIGGDIT